MWRARTRRQRGRGLAGAAAVLLLLGLAGPTQPASRAAPAAASTEAAGNPDVDRLAGATRIETAVAIAQDAFPGTAARVYLARSDVFVDALAAGPLEGGPVLLVPRCATVPQVVLQEIDRLDPQRVTALGGPAAVCDDVLEGAAQGRPHDRLAGQDRFETAARIAAEAFPDGSDKVYLARADDPPDAVAGGVLTAGPLVLVPNTGGVPASTLAEIERLDPVEVVALGGPAAISDDVHAAAAQGRLSSRVHGADRIATAGAIASYQFGVATAVGAPADTIYLARSDLFADAVAGGSLTGGPILLVPQCGDLPDAVADQLRRLQPGIVTALGGPAAVCDELLDQVPAAATVDTTISEATYVLDDTDRAALEVFDAETGTLQFSEPVPELDVGTVVVSEPTDAAPHGLLQTVTAVDAQGQLVDSETAALTDAVEEGAVSATAPLHPGALVEGEALADGVSVGPAMTTTAPSDEVVVAEEALLELRFDDVVLFDLDGDPDTTHDQVVLNGHLDLDLGVEVDLDIRRRVLLPYVHRLAFTLVAEEEAEAEVTSGDGLSFEGSIDVWYGQFAPITVFIAHVPVVFTPELVVSVGASGEVEFEVRWGAGQTMSYRAGLEYADGDGWSPVRGASFAFTHAPPTLSGNASARAGVAADAALLLYGHVGPTAAADLFIRGTAQVPGIPAWALYAGLEVDVGFDASLPLVGELVSHEARVYDLEFLLAQADRPDDPPDDPPDPAPVDRIAYGVSFTSPSELHIVDPAADGADDLVGPIPTDDGADPPMGDIELTPDGRMYGVGIICGLFTCDSRLYEIDPETGEGTRIGTSSAPGEVNALAFSPDGRLLAASQDGVFLEYDLETGEHSAIGVFGDGLGSSGDLEFAADGTLYAAAARDDLTFDVLVTVDPATGQATRVDPAADLGFGEVFGLFFYDGQLFGATIDTPGCDAGALILIDTDTATAELRRCIAFEAGGAASLEP